MLTLSLLFIIGLSFLWFYIINQIINYFGPPSSLITAGKSNKKTSISMRFWKYRNVFVSLIHSTITGFFSVLCFYMNESIRADLIHSYTIGCTVLVAFSLGYFVHDVYDMLLNNQGRKSYELVGHHIIIFICFGISILTQMFVGYALVALLVEVNSVFLHLRQILNLLGYNKTHTIFRINNIINIGTFLVFRMVTLAWMTRWLVINRSNVTLLYYTIGSIGMAIMTLMNIILFYRIIYNDFVKPVSSKSEKSHFLQSLSSVNSNSASSN